MTTHIKINKSLAALETNQKKGGEKGWTLVHQKV